VLITAADVLLTQRQFSSASNTRLVSMLIQLLLGLQRNISMQLPALCIMTCSFPDSLDSSLRALAQLELAVPSPSLHQRVAITALHLQSTVRAHLSALVSSELGQGGSCSSALSLVCETMSGFRFCLLHVHNHFLIDTVSHHFTTCPLKPHALL
jgi:hypothetical protein